MRRTILQGAAGALIRPLNAPPAVKPAPGVQPGGPSTLRARRVIIVGPDDSLLVYEGNAGPGNLIASIVSGAGTDGIPGNELLPDITDYARVGSPIAAVSLTSGSILFSTAATQAGPYFGHATIEWDTVNNQLIISPGGNPIALNGPLVSTAGNIQLVEGNWIYNPGFSVAASDPATPGTAASWQIVNPLPANWSVIGTGDGIKYKLYENKTVRFQVSAQIAAAAVAGTITLATLGAPYTPVKQFRGGCAPAVFVNGAPAATTFDTRLQVTTAGVYEFLGFPGGAGGGAGGVTEINGQWDVPLD